MADQRSSAARRAAVADGLGGAPGRFAVFSVVLTAVWFPLRLFLDSEDPLATVLATAGLYGAIWALMAQIFDVMARHASTRPRSGQDRSGPAHVRRGAIVGLAVGVPFHGALLLFCVATGQSAAYPISYGVVLLGVVVVAVVRLRGHYPGGAPTPAQK